MQFSPVQIALLAGAAIFGLIGLYFIWYLPRPGRETGGDYPLKWGQGLSLPTRLLTGFAALLLGYHLAIWAFPQSLTSLQVPRDRWWLLVLGAIGAVLASIALDRSAAAEDAGANQTRD